MPYDASLDEVLWQEKTEVGEFAFEVKVMQYNKGTPKINVQRFRGEMFTKLGRLTAEEMEALLPIMQKALEALKEKH